MQKQYIQQKPKIEMEIRITFFNRKCKLNCFFSRKQISIFQLGFGEFCGDYSPKPSNFSNSL